MCKLILAPIFPLLVSLLLLMNVGIASSQQFSDPPARPRVATIGNAPGWITIYYSHSGGGGVLWYLVERQGGGSAILSAPEGFWVDPNLEPDTKYVYHVCAIYEDEDEPVCSDWIEGWTMPAPGRLANYEPPIITGFQVSTDSMRVTWGETGDYTKILARNEDLRGTTEQLELRNVPHSSVTFNNLIPGMTYKVLLKGCSWTLLGDSCGPWSPDAFIPTASYEDPPAPSKPRLKMSGLTETTISLEFSVKIAVANAADRFLVYRDGTLIQEMMPSSVWPTGWTGSYTDAVQAEQRYQDYHVCFEGHSPRADVCSDRVRLSRIEVVEPDLGRVGPPKWPRGLPK